MTLFNLLASASISAAGTGLDTLGTSVPALPVHPVYHEHQHQQQEGQVLHSGLLTRYGLRIRSVLLRADKIRGDCVMMRQMLEGEIKREC